MSNVFVIHFAEDDTSGYLFVRSLARGKDGEAILLKSIDSGKLAVRKYALQEDPDDPTIKRKPWLSSTEVRFVRMLSPTGIGPAHISTEGCEKLALSVTMEYANGGTVFDYYTRTLGCQSKLERQGFLWLLLGEGMRIFTYLQTGFKYVAPTKSSWVQQATKGKWVSSLPEDAKWLPICHSDAHMANVFLSWDGAAIVPKVLLGDWSRANLVKNFSYSETRAELEVTTFLNSALGCLHPRPTLSIERKATEIIDRMIGGESVLDIVRSGLYEQCMPNFAKLDVILPRPMRVPGGGKAKVFDLSPGPAWSGASKIADMHCLSEALKIGAPYKMMRVPKEDISELGNVDMARAVEVSKEEIKQVTGGSSRPINKAHSRNEALVPVDLETDIPMYDF